MPYYQIQVSCSGLSPDMENSINANSGLSNKAQPAAHSDAGMNRLMRSFEQYHCQRLRLGLNYSDFNFPDTTLGLGGSKTWRENFTGLGCRTNRSLRFLAIDSILYQSFTENLGINIFNEMHATVALIADTNQENIFV